MALIPFSLYFRGNRQYGVGNITFDLILTESHNFNNNVTTHPVEDGSFVDDHVQNQLENGSITGLFTNFSIYDFGTFSNKAQDAFDKLVELWEAKELVRIVSVLRVYESVAIVSMPIARDEDTGEGLVVQINFKQMRVVKLQEIQLETSIKVANLNSNANRQVAKSANSGRTTTSAGGSIL